MYVMGERGMSLQQQQHLCEDEHVIIALAARLLLVHLDDAVHDGDVAPVDVEDHHLPCPERRAAHVEEQDVPPVERWLHAAAQHHHHLSSSRVAGEPDAVAAQAACSVRVAADAQAGRLGSQLWQTPPFQLDCSSSSVGWLTGDSLPVSSTKPFQIMSAVVTMRPAVTAPSGRAGRKYCTL